MLHKVSEEHKAAWLMSVDCQAKGVLDYMTEKGSLRDTQIDALGTYLYLKLACDNKPLWRLFSEGDLLGHIDLNKLNINQECRAFLQEHTAARALFHFSRLPNGNDTLLPQLAKIIVDEPERLDYEKVIKNLFYNVSYADYLMSLPMGAGKTFLMAAIIYLDLYFALNEPDNPVFAHNFLVLVPSGLKSSIVPSLRTIESFDPSWVIPEPSASHIKKLLNFEVLDVSKSAKKSNKARNPNAQKISQCLPNPFGRVFVVNAEKVILNRLDSKKQLDVFDKTEDEKDNQANELRNLISKIPNMSLLIDEVHHAATDDIKLRQVVNQWQEGGNITTVLG